MEHVKMMEKLVEHYEDEKTMWTLAKEKAQSFGYFTAVEDYNIVRCQNKIDQVKELIVDAKEKTKSLHEDLYGL